MTGGAAHCVGCEAGVGNDVVLPFSCGNARAGDDIDHLLRLDVPDVGEELPADGDPNPFIRYRKWLWIWHAAAARGISDAEYIELTHSLDESVSAVDGRGFRITPYEHSEILGARFKNETGNVAGSHKARHLMGTAIYLSLVERAGLAPWQTQKPVLAIASCGNAALAAAVVARAASRALRVFIPTWANPNVVDKLRGLDAELVVCERREEDPPGDPCVLRFREAVAAGALPFSCQGPDNAIAIDGGRTLGYELAAQSAATPMLAPSHLFIQIGGGALASSCIQALSLAAERGALERMPALIAVQTRGGAPLARAWNLTMLAARPAHALERARTHRSELMWPWEAPPSSLADGILDDETYDWWQILAGVERSGGLVLRVGEDLIEHARDAAAASGIEASHTGSAGYAGLLAAKRVFLAPDTRPAVLFTGASR